VVKRNPSKGLLEEPQRGTEKAVPAVKGVASPPRCRENRQRRQTLISRHERLKLEKLRRRVARYLNCPACATSLEALSMPSPQTGPEILEREFLETRCKLLEVAAALDRLDRADGSVSGDPRRQKVQRALGILANTQENRAEQLQRLFSLDYEPDWRKKFFG
jgi:hypothetical protein